MGPRNRKKVAELREAQARVALQFLANVFLQNAEGVAVPLTEFTRADFKSTIERNKRQIEDIEEELSAEHQDKRIGKNRNWLG